MKRVLALLSLFLMAACASNDGFVENNRTCESGAEVGIEAGLDTSTSSVMETGGINRLNMVVQVSNNSNKEITVKRVNVDPMTMDRDSPYELDRGSREVNKVIAEGDASTIEIPMNVRRRLDGGFAGRTMRTNRGVDFSVTVLLEPDQTYRCRFRVPLDF